MGFTSFNFYSCRWFLLWAATINVVWNCVFNHKWCDSPCRTQGSAKQDSALLQEREKSLREQIEDIVFTLVQHSCYWNEWYSIIVCLQDLTEQPNLRSINDTLIFLPPLIFWPNHFSWIFTNPSFGRSCPNSRLLMNGFPSATTEQYSPYALPGDCWHLSLNRDCFCVIWVSELCFNNHKP